MPKIVNKEERQNDIAKAVWRIVSKEGLHQATVRRVAQEAGLSVGSLRQSFKTQEALYEYAMRLMMERLIERVDHINESDKHSASQNAFNILLNFLPLKGSQEKEMRVWLAFLTEAMHTSDLKKLNDSMFDQTREYFILILTYLREEGSLKKEVNIQQAAVDLHAFLDGLTLHRLIRPEVMNDKVAQETLEKYLADLCI